MPFPPYADQIYQMMATEQLSKIGAVYMPAPQTGSPMNYMLDGRQYIVVAISTANYSGELVALRLPADTNR